jgi:SAM-dependent methyltransferase
MTQETMNFKTEKTPYLAADTFDLYRIAWQARKKMLKTLLETAKPTSATTVLDIGITKDTRQVCNFFEKLYPYPDKITAVGDEDPSGLQGEFPKVKIVRADGLALPFADRSFDLAVSFAVLEHAGSREQQRKLVHEICRVGKTAYIVTPNRWHPLEFHTFLPLAHWLPPVVFRFFLKLIGKSFLACEDNLNLLSKSECLDLFPPETKICVNHFRFLGFKSNFMFYAIT